MSELNKNIELKEELLLFDPKKSVTRESCLECVTKHFSAALVLSSEILAGYDKYEYLFIGHLHEAHEESQEFPRLYTELVKARRDYQRYKKFPDFEKIAETIFETRIVVEEYEKKTIIQK